MTAPRQAAICVLPHAAGWHQASWRRPESNGHDIWNWDLWKDMAQTAERGKLDAVFLADLPSLWTVPEALRHKTAKVGQWEAFTLLSAMAPVTERIGLVATGHTQYNHPYNIARKVACLDHLSHGRAGWNVVTSAGPEQAINFGLDTQVPTAERYERAWEFVDVVRGLWDSWEDDAYVVDKEAGVFFDPAKLHTLNHVGKYFKVAGPLNIMRPPQGYPVLAQAGSSGPGKRLAAGIGEIVFTHLTGDAGRAYYRELKDLAADMGRNPDHVKLLPQLTPLVGRTDSEARAKWDELQALLEPRLNLGVIEAMLDMDLSDHPLDEPLPDPPEGTSRVQGARDAVYAYAKQDNPTLRELLARYEGPGTIIGSPTTIADYMQAELDEEGADGFVVLLHGVPEELNDFVDLVVPELQRRGLFRTEYEGTTLRDHLRLPRPENQFAGTGAATAAST